MQRASYSFNFDEAGLREAQLAIHMPSRMGSSTVWKMYGVSSVAQHVQLDVSASNALSCTHSIECPVALQDITRLQTQVQFQGNA
jgi:hypothetical protein